jgi:hypothetical protein
VFAASKMTGPAGKSAVDRELLILVGNELSGLTEVSRVKGDWLIGESGVFDVKVYPSPLVARGALVRSNRAVSRSQPGRRLHCVASGGWRIEEVSDYGQLAATLATGSSVASEADGRAPVTRLALVANPGRAYDVAKRWISRDGSPINWRPVPIPVWTDDAVYFHLQEVEKPELYNSDEARVAILNASCGFGAEIERLCSGALPLDRALQAPANAEQRLAPDLATFYRRIGMPAAVDQKDLENGEFLLSALDGASREPDETERFRAECGVSGELFVFLQWMGLLQEASNGTWHVPKLYRRLLP